MSHILNARPFRKRQFRTLSLLCNDEPLSDVQIKACQAKIQEYENFLDSVVRLALCGNVCVTEETVSVGEHGLLTGEALNALQHAGAISVYNTLQQNNWEFPVPEDGEVAVIKSHVPVPDEFLDCERPVRSDWPAVHISECFIEGEKAKLHGSVRPLRTFLPPTVLFSNATDMEDDMPESELDLLALPDAESPVVIVPTVQGIAVKRITKCGKDAEYIPLGDYFFGREEGNQEYAEERGDFRFKCAVCQRIFYSNIKLMSHMLGHLDESSIAGLIESDLTHCVYCALNFSSAFQLQTHYDQEHAYLTIDPSVPGRQESKDDSSFSNVTTQHHWSQHAIGSYESGNGLNCRICGKKASDTLDLAQHLQSTHRQREMPYVCRLCLFRSSLFEDILDHFKKAHDNSNHLLCTYCLRIFTPSDAGTCFPTVAFGSPSPGSGIGQTQVYLQHLRMHQVQHQIRRCPSCKLNFTNKSDYQVHRRLDHRATRVEDINRSQVAPSDAYEPSMLPHEDARTSGSDLVQPLNEPQPHITLMNAPDSNRTKILNSLSLPRNIDLFQCLECNQSLGSSDHRKYLSCTMCRFGTFCSVGYSRHLNKGHVYISGAQPSEPDVSSPLIRPVYFSWIAEQARSFDFSKSNVKRGLEGSLPSTPETGNHGPKLCSDRTQADTSEEEAFLMKTHSNDLNLARTFEQVTVVSQHENALAVAPTFSLPTTGICLDVNSGLSASDHPEAPAESDAISNFSLTENVTRDQQGPPHETTHHDQPHSACASCSTGMDTDRVEIIPLADNPWELLEKYMETRLDARVFACIHCAATGLCGNALARHLFEECGTSTATLHPDEELVQVRKRLDEEYRRHREQQLAERSETDILFESTESSLSHRNVASSDSMPHGDVTMDATPSYDVTESQHEQRNVPFGDQMTVAGGTSIDITDASGEVVQQFIIPEDFQLEEGQTLVVIQDETGQPQLAIVNQTDLVDSGSPSVEIQPDGDSRENMFYAAADAVQERTDGIVERDDEKENRHFTI